VIGGADRGLDDVAVFERRQVLLGDAQLVGHLAEADAPYQPPRTRTQHLEVTLPCRDKEAVTAMIGVGARPSARSRWRMARVAASSANCAGAVPERVELRLRAADGTPIFRVPTCVEFGLDNGRRIEHPIVCDAREQTFSFFLRARPRTFSFDPDADIVKSVELNVPKEMLVRQLAAGAGVNTGQGYDTRHDSGRCCPGKEVIGIR